MCTVPQDRAASLGRTALHTPCIPHPTPAQLKRAGLDYWGAVCVKTHTSWDAFAEFFRELDGPKRLVAFTVRRALTATLSFLRETYYAGARGYAHAGARVITATGAQNLLCKYAEGITCAGAPGTFCAGARHRRRLNPDPNKGYP
eukprot:360325-Chlamydomonas_euryale.AAC.3